VTHQGSLRPHTEIAFTDGQLLAEALGWRSRRSGLRGGIDRCVRIHSCCHRSRTHHFKACFHKARSHYCPRQEDRREQAYDGEQTRVAWTLAAAIGRPFIHMHDPHSLKSLEAGFDAPTIFYSRIDPRQFHYNFTSCLLIVHERSKYAARRGCNDLDPAQMTEP
jgi:hypothetical protein